MTELVPSNSCRLILIRHGQTNDNLSWRLSGWTDTPLNQHGRSQARRLARYLARHWRIDALYSSPLQRAAETARAVADEIGLAPVHHDGLREMHFGHCEGLTEAEWQARFPELTARARNESDPTFCWPGGESRQEFHRRVQTVLGELSIRHAGEAIAVVCHGGLISSYLCQTAGQPLSQWRSFMVHNCSVSAVHVELSSTPPRANLLRFNDVDHLTLREEAFA